MSEVKGKSLHINAVLNIIKQCCAIIFPMITFPYVSRVLGVEMYGKYNFASSIVSYISLLAGLGISSYAIRDGAKLRDNKLEFEKFASEVFSINILSTIIAYMIMFFLLLGWDRLDNYRILILISSINIFLITIGTDWVNIVYEDFLFLTIRYLVCQTMAVILTIVFVKSPDDVYLYAFFSNFGITSANLLNLYYIRSKMQIHPRFTLQLNLKKHFKPIMILFGNVVSSMIYLYADSSMLGILVGDVAVGYYAVASKIYMLIKQMLNAVANVATPRFSHDISKTDKSICKQFNSLLGILILFMLPCMMGLLCVGKEIIIFLSGMEYVRAYSALAILSFSLIFSTVACIFVSVVMLASGMDKEIFTASTISAVVNIVLNFFLIPLYNYNAAALTTLISEFLMMVMGVWYTREIVKISIFKELVVGTIGMAWVFVVCVVLRSFAFNPMIYLCVSVGVSVLGYGIVLFEFLRNRKNH